MQHDRHLIVRGRQKREIDPNLLVQILLAIANDWQGGDTASKQFDSVDTFDAAIEDRGAAS